MEEKNDISDATIPFEKQKLASCGLPSGSFCSSSVAKATNSSQTEPAGRPRLAILYFSKGIAASAVVKKNQIEDCSI